MRSDPRWSVIPLVAFSLLFLAADQNPTSPPAGPAPAKKVGTAGKNLQVLLYDDPFILVVYMQAVQKSLGVSCVHCHNLDDFSVDEPKADRNIHKNAARSMMRMVLNLNEYIKNDPNLKKAVGATPIRPIDLTNPGRFVKKLREATDPVSKYLRKCFSDELIRYLNDYDGAELLPTPFEELLVDELNQVIRSGRLYDKERFTGVPLSPETEQLLNTNPDGEELVRLNRILLQEAYPGDIAEPKPVDCFLCHQGTLRPSQKARPEDPFREQPLIR
ncbi:MAG TPA: hypothetical protein PLQ35_04470 [bacterium]|nr:hypothetical protein [bacterium]HQL61527.1 hypothetical protein [bacterium]